MFQFDYCSIVDQRIICEAYGPIAAYSIILKGFMFLKGVYLRIPSKQQNQATVYSVQMQIPKCTGHIYLRTLPESNQLHSASLVELVFIA